MSQDSKVFFRIFLGIGLVLIEPPRESWRLNFLRKR